MDRSECVHGILHEGLWECEASSHRFFDQLQRSRDCGTKHNGQNLRNLRRFPSIAVRAFSETALGKRGSPSANSCFAIIRFMPTPDDFSTYIADLLKGTYDCVDRISVRGYFPMGQTSGGLLTWWNKLYPGRLLTQEQLRRMSGDLGRRITAYARKHATALHYFEVGDKSKHAKAEKLRPANPNFQGLFTIFVVPRVRPWSGRLKIIASACQRTAPNPFGAERQSLLLFLPSPEGFRGSSS